MTLEIRSHPARTDLNFIGEALLMNQDNQNGHFSEIQNDAIVLFKKVGMSSELISDKILGVSSDFAQRFHQELIDSKVVDTWHYAEKWLAAGHPCQLLNPGGQWQKGRLRLRITAEFVPDEPEIAPTDRPIEPSLDTFRESP
jgi:hypothetical protein